MDGLETLTFTVYQNAIERIGGVRRWVTIGSTVQCILFVLVCIRSLICFLLYVSIFFDFIIYIVLFRPFVSKLKQESEQTFSILRMIPRKLLKDIPEIKHFIQHTLQENL